VVTAVVLALLPGTAVADTVDPTPTQQLTTSAPPVGVARNPANGNLYVSEQDTSGGGSIHVWAGEATGSAPELWAMPVPGGCVPWQITFRPDGGAMLLACTTAVLEVDPQTLAAMHSWTGLTGARAATYDGGGKVLVTDYAADTVVVFDASTSGSTGMTALTATSGLADPTGIAYGNGLLYVANHATDTVLAFPHTPGGSPGSTPARSLILPADVNETNAVALDGAGNLYVGAFAGGILLYPPGADGAATPTRRLDGPSSGSGTLDLDVFPDGRLFVGQMDASGLRVVVFAAQFPTAPPTPQIGPGAVTGLKVTGPKTARKRTVTWAAAPAGSSPITTYTVVVAKGTKRLVRASTSATRLVLKRKKLAQGKLAVTVTAVSAVGAGPATRTTFKVKFPRKKSHGDRTMSPPTALG
jgi:DNA-binding beta-propeller fold protein YncE